MSHSLLLTLRKYTRCIPLEGWVADIFDVRENPDLTSYDGIIVGSKIYYSKIDQPLKAYLIKNAHAISGKILMAPSRFGL
jgi:menaquinone-dependent protoporphyrinogen IX oxidase